MYKTPHITIAVLLLFFSVPISAQQLVITAANQNKVGDIFSYANISAPTEKNLSINTLLQNPSVLPFNKPKENAANISFTASHYWLKFDIKNATTSPLTYYLETARPITDNVDCYIINAQGTIESQHSGDNMPFANRAVPHNKTMFQLLLQPNSSYQIYIHYKSDGEVLNMPLVLHSPPTLIAQTQNQQLVFGIFYGFLILAAIIYLFFYVGMGDKSFLYYGLYVITVGLLQFSLDGLFYQYVMPGSGWLYLRSLLLIAIVSPYFMSKYVVAYLHIKEGFTILSKILKGLNIGLGLLFLGLLISPTVFQYGYPIANLLGLAVLLVVIISMVATWLQKRQVDWFFAIGIFCLVLGFVIFILTNLGILPDSILTKHSTKLGTGLEVLFLSLSMSNRIRLLKSEKEKSQEIALQKAQEANEVKTYFMSMMSHELRTPLNAIMGIADVMEKETIEQKIKSNFALIKHSSVSLLNSVNDILDFSKLSNGELKLQVDDFNPIALINKTKANWEIQAKNKGVNFTYEAAIGIPDMLSGDEQRLSQILNNLLSNAVKFTSKGAIHLKVSYTAKDATTINLQLSISDTGVGIPKEKLSSIFESFMQENIDNKRKFGGFGLGLSIVKNLVELQNGTITLKSEIDEGTTATVTVPYTIAKQQPKKENNFSKDVFDLKGSKILVVEDNDVNQFIMKTILQRWKNTEIVLADNGSEALVALQNGHYDVVLMDLQMPVMDGYEATKEIRNGSAGEGNKKIPIIAITADVMETTRQKTINVGMNDYMTKPVDQALLYEKIVLQLTA